MEIPRGIGSGTAALADESLHELTFLYMPGGVAPGAGSTRGRGKKKVAHTRLDPLEFDASTPTPSSVLKSQSASSLRRSDAGFPVGKSRFDDFHYVSNLQHRVANLAKEPGSAKVKSSPSVKDPTSAADLAQRVEEVQLRTLQESEVLTAVTTKIANQYRALEEVAQTIMTHRKELSGRISEINQGYVDMFETMLGEIMRIQRLKFKSQTSLIEDLRAAVDALEGKLVLEKEQCERLRAQKQLVAEQLAKTEIDLRTSVHQLRSLQTQLECEEGDKVRIEEEARRAAAQNQERELAIMVENIKQNFQSRMVSEKAKLEQDMYKLRNAVEEKGREICELHANAAQKAREHAALLKEFEESKFKRPKVESGTQTTATEDGLWDQQNGWVLPISSTALARSRWRRCINFSRCPACRGNARYIAQAAALFKQATVGTAPQGLVEEGALLEDCSMKWVLPDSLVAFMVNLPPTVQAWNPNSLMWTMKTTILLFEYKAIVDAEDRALGYRLQNFSDFVVETFLRTVDNRSQAELNLYQYLRSLREHHKHQALLHLVARCLQCSGALSKDEEKLVHELRARGQAALKRKRRAQIEELGARDRSKAVQDSIDREVEESKVFRAENPLYERDFRIHEDVLSKEIVSVCLFAKKCLLAEPYKGVYVQGIYEAKKAMAAFVGFEQSLHRMQAKLLPEGSKTIHFPAHCFFHVQDKCQQYVPLDRAIRVVKPFLAQCTAAEVLGVYRAIESRTTFIFPDGDIHLPDGMNSFVRSTLRVFVQATSPTGSDIRSWQTIKELAEKAHLNRVSSDAPNDSGEEPLSGGHPHDIYAKYSAKQKAKAPAIAKARPHQPGDILHEDVYKYTLITDVDYILLIISELYLRRFQAMDKQLLAIFEAGDINKDNVLSFPEFKAITKRVNKDCADRKVLSMFREALLQGEEKDTIGPQAFVNVCKEHDLINMMDQPELERTSLSGLSMPRGEDYCHTARRAREVSGNLAHTAAVAPPDFEDISSDSEGDVKEMRRQRPARRVEVGVQTVEAGSADAKGSSKPPSKQPRLDSKSGAAVAMQSVEGADGHLSMEEAAESHGQSVPGDKEVASEPVESVMIQTLPIKNKPMAVNMIKSKQYSEQIQQALQQRKLRRLQQTEL